MPEGLETDGPNRKAEKYRTWKMPDQITGLENAGLVKCRNKSQGWKMQDLIMTELETTDLYIGCLLYTSPSPRDS